MDFSLYRSMDADKRQIYGRRRLYTILYIARTLWWRNFRANLPFSAQWLLTHNSPSLFPSARHSSTTHMREMLWRPSQARRLQHWRRLILSTRLLLEISFSNWPVPDDPCVVISTATSHHQWPSCHYFVNNSNATYIYVGGSWSGWMRYAGPFGVWWSWWIYIRTHLNETLYCVSTESFDLLRHPCVLLSPSPNKCPTVDAMKDKRPSTRRAQHLNVGENFNEELLSASLCGTRPDAKIW